MAVLGEINRAGITTSSREVLRNVLGIPVFANADAIARGLNAFNPESGDADRFQIPVRLDTEFRAVAFAGLALGVAFGKAIFGRGMERAVAQTVFVAKVGEIPEGGSTLVEVNNRDVAVFLVDGNYYAIDDLCPHAGASLSGGPIEDGIVTCPWHYWRFRLSDGAWADNPRVKTGWYPVRVTDGEIWLDVPEKKIPVIPPPSSCPPGGCP